VAFLVLVACARAASAAVTFPLEAKWSATLPAAPAFVPAFDATRIYLPLQTKQLVALMIKDGSVAWSVECPMTAAPAAGDGLVYAGSEDLIEARAEGNGAAQWRRPIQGRVVSLHWDTGWLFAQSEPGVFFALRASDGAILWQKDFGSPLAERASPAPAGDRLYLPLKDGRVVALSLQNGDEIWTHKLAEPAAGILPVGDRVFVGGRDNQFHSLNADDGDSDWRWPTGADLLGLPVLDARRVYFVALDNILRGHNRNSGTMSWKQVLPVRPFTGPLLSGDTLIVTGVAAELHGYNTADGKSAGPAFTLKGAENEEMLLAGPPYLTAQDLLILVTKGGQVRAVGSPAPGAAPPPETAPAPGAASPAETPPPAAPDVPPTDAPSPAP
jgi:outer membrane protein assembly factor BamB